jgi:hypothetical protein
MIPVVYHPQFTNAISFPHGRNRKTIRRRYDPGFLGLNID